MMVIMTSTTKVHSDESFRGNKTKTKNDLSDDGEDDYTGKTSRPTTHIGLLTLALMMFFVLTRPWKALCVLQFLFFRFP